MRFIEIPALITEDIEDPNIVDITETETVTASISGTTLTINGDSKVSGETTITLTGDVTVDAIIKENLRQPSIHKIIIKTNGAGNFTYVPNNTVTASSVSTTTKTGSDLEILLITTSGGDTYLDLDVADYVSPAANFSNVVTGFKVSELTSTYGATAKLYKPDGTLLTTVNSETMGSGVNFGYTESPGDVIYKLEVTDDLGRKSTYNLPRKWINYAMGTTSTPGFQKFRLEGIDYTTTMTLPSLGSSSTAKVYRTSDHGYMGIKFKIQGRNAPSDDWVDIANADENDDVLAFGDYLYHRVWVKPTAKATTTVSSSNVVTLTLSNLTEENVTTSFTGADPFEIDETSNVFVFEETAKIGTVPFTVTLGTETYTNAVTATTEEVSTVPNTDMTAAGPNKLHDIQLSQTGGYMSEASGNGKYIAYNKTNDSVVYILKGDPVSGYTDYTTITYSQVTNAYLVGSMTYDGKYIIIARRGSNSYHYEIWKHDESAETYTKLSQTVQTIDTSTYVHKPAFVPAEGNYNFAISGHNSSSGQDFSVQLYKHTVGTDTWTAQTIISNPRPSSVQGTTSNRSMQAKSFTKDGKYLMFGNTSTYGGYDVFNVDFDENTVTHAGNWVNNGDIGHSGSITSDGKYILLFDDDSNSRKIFKNNDAGDWSSSTDVTSDFTFEDTDNDQGYGICFFGENSEYFVSTGASGGAVRVYRWYPKKEVTLTFSNPTLTLTGQNVTISSAKLYRDDVLFHTYGTESNVVLRSDQTGAYQAIVNDVYYSNRITPDFTTTRSVSAPQLEFDGYNRLSLNNITPTSTTLGVPDGTTRDLTTQSNVYIYKSGTYTANVQTSETFAYLSNVVTGEITIKTSNSYNLFQNFGTTDYTDTEGRTIENLNSYSNGNLSGSDLASWTDRGWTYSGTINLHDDAYNVTGITGDISTNFHGSGSTTGYFDKTLPSGAIGIIIRFGQTYNNSTGRAQVFIYNNGTEVTSTSSKSYSTTLTEETLYFPASPNNVIRLHESGTGVFAVTHILTETYTVTPKLTFDGFNKLSIENITQTSSTLEYGSNTYDTNTASNVYVTDAGEYVLEASDANTFVTSNVEVGALDTVPGFTAAFHHGAFSASDYSSAYSSVAEAATAGFVYSDTPAGEYTWGTLAHVKERENPDFTANSTLHTDYSSTYGWTTNSGWEVSAKDEFSTTYEVWKAFSKTYASNNNWLSGSAPSENSPQWIKIKYPSQQVIKSYVIRARENASPRWPTAWKLQGSNNDSEWTDIGTEQTQTEWVPNQNKSFDLSTNTTAYQYYRLRITGARESASSSNSDYVAIGHWFLFTETSGSTVHTKYTRYTYTPPASTITANVLRVAGGGGGSGTRGGGGGAGGLLYSENVSLSGTKSIVVGNGGIGYEGTQQSIENGYDTVFTGLTTSIGGGHGGGNDAIIPTPGGSGGGGSARIAAVGTGAAGTSGQGNAGGNGSSGDTFNGGGGGGAGAVGGDSGGVGGVGLDYSSVFGTTYGVSGFFAGGGGGGTSSGGNTGGNGGGGGGSYGHGTKHTGGGGAGIGNGSGTSGDGGSGIVLIKKLGPINPPTLNFDGYNKLTIDNVDTVETATIKKDGAAFATTTSNTVYIRNTGTYTAEVKGSGEYAIELSNVVGTINNALTPSFPFEIYNVTTSSLFTEWSQTDGLVDLSGYTGTDILVLVPTEGLQQNTDWHVKWTFDFTDLSGAMLTTISTYGNRYTVNGDLLYGDLRNDSKGDMSIATTGTSTQLLAPYPQVTHTVLDTNLGNGVYRRTVEYIKEGDNFTFKMNGAEYTDANNPYTMQRTNGLINIRSGTYTGENLLYPNIRINSTNVELSSIKVDTYTGYYGEPSPPPLTYDNYNKITLNQLNYEDTATVSDPNGSTYNIGTAKTMYVKNTGDYVFKISGTDKYVESNVYVSSVDLAGAPTKPIDFDGYNKLTLIDAGSNVSANVTYFSNTYDLGSANVLYINGAGTYDLEMSGSNVFALSNTFVGTISSLPDTLLHLDFESGGLVSTGLNTTQYKYGSSSLYRNNSSVTVSNDGSYNIGNTSSAEATIMLWVRPESYPDYNGNANRIIVAAEGRSESSASYKKWAIVLREHSSIDEVWQFHYPNSSNTDLKVSYTPSDVPAGAWYHVCVTIESGSLKFYIDGVDVTSSLTGSKSDIESAWAGFNDDEGFKFCKTDANYLKGWVDDFKLFNSVLTLSEITAHMNASKLSSPSLTFDNYNKLTLENFTTTESDTRTATLTDPNGSTYALGQTQDAIYIKDQGDYFLEVTNSDQSAVVKKTVTGTLSASPGTPLMTSILVTRNNGSDYTEASPSTERNGAWESFFVVGNVGTVEMDGSSGSGVGFSMYLNFDQTFTVNTAVFKMISTYQTYKDVSFRCGTSESDYITVDPGGQNFASTQTITFTFSSPITVNKLYFAVVQDNGNDLYNLRMTNGDIIINGLAYPLADSDKVLPSPVLNFDTYNKLSIENLTPTSSRLTYGSNTYEIGTASNVYIEHGGTYKMATGDANTFALVSKQVNTPAPKPDYTNIWAGEYGGMVIDSDGKLYTWGNDGNNQSGRGASDRTPTHISTISDPVSNVWVEGAAGRTRIVKTSTDKWYMWGMNLDKYKIFGQTGDQATPVDVTSDFTTYFGAQGTSDSTRIIKVVTSASACSALAADGKVWSWGVDGNRNELGKNTTNGTTATPFKNITSTRTVIQHTGDWGSAGVWDGTLVSGMIYQYSIGSYPKRFQIDYSTGQFTKVGTHTSYTWWKNGTQVTMPFTASEGDTIKIDDDSTQPPYDSEFNMGPLGTNTELSNITDICCLLYGKIALDSNGDVWQWGTLRTGSTGYPTKQTGLDSITIIGIGAGYFTAYAWTTDGTIYSIGQGTEGQLGNGADSDQDSTWQTVTTLQGKTIYGIYGAGYSVFAHTSDGVYACGQGTNGRLGMGNNNNLNVFTKSTTLSALSIYKLDFGHGPGYVITTDGKGYALGYDYLNSIPTPLSGDKNVPTEASSLTNLSLVYQPPSLTYDTSNKLSIENLTPTSTTLTDPNGSSFDIGTASNVYIRDSGTYSIASKDANTFVLASNTVTGTPTGTTYVYDSNTFTTPSQTYDTTKTITVSNVPSTLTDVVGKIYKGSTAYTIHATTSSSNVIIKNTGTYVSVFTTATQAFLTNAIDVTTQPTTTSDDTTIEDEGFIPGSTAVPTETTTDAPSVTLDATDTTVTDPTLDLDFTTTLPRTLKRYNGVTNSSIGARFNRRESNKKRIEKSISIPTRFSAELTANNASSPTTLTVTVANSKFVINGDETPTLGFIRGETYTFDQSDASNSGHPLVLATSEDGATQYTTGWTTTPSSPDYVPGVSGAQGTFIVPYDVPDTIYYKCNVHSNMGGEINTTFGNVFSLGDFTVAANTHVSGEYTLATNYDGTTSNLYVNGDLITQITPSPVISAGVKEFILGKEFDGYVKNFKFWNYNFIPPYNRIPGTFQKNGINGNSTLYYLLGARAVEATPWYSTYHMPQSTSKADAFAITSGGTSIANGGVNTSRGTYPTIDPGLSIGSGHVVANSFHFATDMTKIDKIYFLSANGTYGLEFSLQDYADVPAPASGGGDVGGTITITDKFGYTATSIYALKRVSNAEDPWINTGTNHNYTQMFYGDSTGDAGGSHMSDNGGFYIYASLS